MDKYQALVTKIYDAVVESARWGSDAHENLLDQLRSIVDYETEQEELEKHVRQSK